MTTKQKQPREIRLPFGPTSKKQQMIVDCKAQILIMGGELAPQNTVMCI
jgi:hypothetical protein